MSNQDNNNQGRGLASADQETRRQVASEGGSQNTPEQDRARKENIKKAQEARRNDGNNNGGNNENE